MVSRRQSDPINIYELKNAMDILEMGARFDPSYLEAPRANIYFENDDFLITGHQFIWCLIVTVS